MKTTTLENIIYEIRDTRAMLDFHLAELYDVPTKVFNQSVKRNANRFPEDFMFQLSQEEWMIFERQSKMLIRAGHKL
ncbi:MAG: ORF6N domain-containing protein [Chitinophagaceae bacterium]|nr:ORF6N domain-containing protein [Chitinophagaceae bacterium]